eukprot:COSAG02_NODE_23249_length_725_cov_0.723642_2_plen_54_part_00
MNAFLRIRAALVGALACLESQSLDRTRDAGSQLDCKREEARFVLESLADLLIQ